MKTKLTFLIIAAALAAATAGRAQTVISYSTDGGAQALETGVFIINIYFYNIDYYCNLDSYNIIIRFRYTKVYLFYT